jgi:hypothetical protein
MSGAETGGENFVFAGTVITLSIYLSDEIPYRYIDILGWAGRRLRADVRPGL